MSIGTLWTTPYQGKGKTIRAAAAYAGLELTIAENYVHLTDNKKPEFLAKFPHGKIPALETKDGFKLFEGTAIARYVSSLAPNSGLQGHTKEEAALVDQWIHLAESELDSLTDIILSLIRGGLGYSKTVHTSSVERQTRTLKTLNAHLATRTFFVGERITLADIVVASIIQRAVSFTVDAPLRAQVPHVIRHLETIVNQPKFVDIFGPTEYVEKAVQYTPPAKEKKEKDPKPAAPPAPKAEKKPKKEDDDEEDEDPSIKEPPKARSPLEDLPKSTFNLEDWKRAYSNKDTRGADGALEWFYQNFDKEGFSIWKVDFKYNEELTQTFMSSNQIGGFFNRLEASRKYLFGSMGVLGTANNSLISGTLILRGQDATPVVDVAPDWESYSFVKLDLEKPEDKTFFEAALAWDLEIDGKKWADGKNFK
ncbi:elongation factor 1-gamma [Pluteus cervinus]|uniref:Elongation factor 1-gamma n=1 Tax=Pluteus cervinus TaxID=181527 RepID=A0ACD3B0Q9_9AGAR|nr:elongation factor 1-gamma [Pluteus cervinus]